MDLDMKHSSPQPLGGNNDDSMQKASSSEKEKTKLRERQRRAITTKIFAGLRKYGGYNLPPRADINDVLRALASESGWIVEADGTTYRAPGTQPQSSQRPSASRAAFDSRNSMQPYSSPQMITQMPSVIPTRDLVNSNTFGQGNSGASSQFGPMSPSMNFPSATGPFLGSGQIGESNLASLQTAMMAGNHASVQSQLQHQLQGQMVGHLSQGDTMRGGQLLDQTAGALFVNNHLMSLQQSPFTSMMNGQQQQQMSRHQQTASLMMSPQNQNLNLANNPMQSSGMMTQSGGFIMAPSSQESSLHSLPQHGIGMNLLQSIPPAPAPVGVDGMVSASMSPGSHVQQSSGLIDAADSNSSLGIRNGPRPGPSKKPRKGLTNGDVGS